ncbi:MAG: hypothetical protein GY913_14815 [Proteobacteria bacterium]|nr:hypothetical protein [Pseudomonadota bacterium]MCP4918182.1 hypothetical protein [Pseudomonadota bacterium]
MLELTSNWYGLFFLGVGTFTVQGLDVWDGSFTGTSHSYGTLYHGEGDVLMEDVHVWDNQFDFYQAIYGLIFSEEDGGGDQIHRRSSAVNNTVTTGTSFYGSYSLDDVDDSAVVLENIRVVGNTLQSGSEHSNYGWLGYVDNEGSTTVHNLVIAGNHDDGSGKATLVSSFGYDVDAQNWDLVNNTASEASSKPMVQIPGDWTVRNWNVVDNGFGTDFTTGIVADGSLDIDYVNWHESTADGAFEDADGDVTVTNLWSVDPLYADLASWDLTLQETSPVIDVGDPGILDADGSASDLGAHGGPLGASW